MSEKRKGVDDLRKFFQSNPDEELSIADAALKLGVKTQTAGCYLAMLKSMGIVERISVYRVRPE